MLNLTILAIGFILLIYGANYLVNSASSLAGKLNIPNLVIGLTIVAFGTSSPELIVSVIASIEGNSEIALGNVIGSNIFNILAILGISAIILPLVVRSSTTWIEIPLCLFSAILIGFMANLGSSGIEGQSAVNRTDGALLLILFLVFAFYNYRLSTKNEYHDELKVKDQSIKKSVFLILTGLLMLAAGGRFIVQSAVKLAIDIGIPERIIGLTIVSIGTSLPELATSVVAARKGNTDIAIGNIVGSNIFNSFLILGISALINPVPLSEGTNIDLMVNIFASLLLFLFIFTGKGRQIDRKEGIAFILVYLLYLVFILVKI